MKNLNEFEYEQLTTLIEKLIEKKVCEILNNSGVESSFRGTIVPVELESLEEPDSSLAMVQFTDGIKVLLPNNCGEPLEVGDMVIVYGSQSNISNRYIGVKLN